MSRRRRSPKLAAYATVGVAAVAVGILAGRPALVAAAVPLLLVAQLGLRTPPPGPVTGTLAADRPTATEGDVVTVAADVRAPGAGRLDVVLAPTPGLAPAARLQGVRCTDPTPVRWEVACERWGAHRLGPTVVRAHDPLGAWTVEAALPDRPALRVHPRTETLRALVSPDATHAATGSRRSRARGEGLEAADVRPYVPGDPLRRLNQRASARGRGLFVTDRHPDRTADVVLLVDSFADAHLLGRRPTDDAVRIAAALAAGHLRERDRVGLVGLGTGVWWLEGGTGARQLHRIAAALIESQVAVTYAFKGMMTVDRRVLGAHAFLVAITPLVERRSADALHELHRRGYDLVVLEVSPAAYLPPPADDAAVLARRIWQTGRAVQRDRLRASGTAVVEWTPERRLDEVLLEVSAWRRHARPGVSA